MRLVSFAAGGRASFGAVVGDGIVDLGGRIGGARSLRELIATGNLAAAADLAARRRSPDLSLEDVTFLPTIPDAGKLICIGINYGRREAEYKDLPRDAGSNVVPASFGADADAPRYPSVFFRTRESLVGHGEPLLRPLESDQLDYEGEIALVIGKPGRRIPEARAWAHVAGLTLMNEGSVRDWLRHAKFNVTPGKNFARSGSMGPWLVTADEIPEKTELRLTTRVNGEVRQDDTTANLIFPFRRLIAYLSTFMPLEPGDVIATGTPTGAGARFDPPRYLKPGDVVEVHVAEIGTLANRVEQETR